MQSAEEPVGRVRKRTALTTITTLLQYQVGSVLKSNNDPFANFCGKFPRASACVAFELCGLAHSERMAKALFILCMSQALVVPDTLHVIMRHTLPATFAKHQSLRFSLLRPEAKTVDTGGHILCVCNVVVNQHTTFRQWLAWDARTILDFKLAIVLPRCLHYVFPILRLGHCFIVCLLRC
jgi:hypothetical protein